MFDSLALENPKRKWATLMSFTLEATFVGMLIAAPLAFTDKLPSLRFGETLIAPTAPATATPITTQPPPTTHAVTTEFQAGHLVFNGRIPPTTRQIEDPMDADSGPADPNAIVGAVPNQRTNVAVQNLIHAITPPAVAGPTRGPAARIAISHLDAGFLISRVQPIYPRTAMLTRTEGTVMLAAVIDTRGRITQLRAISGHPLLINAAIDAVRQWRYKPYILNGSPVEVETQVSVIFNLNNH